jgi:transcriptional regulator with XRE-family HTH domain
MLHGAVERGRIVYRVNITKACRRRGITLKQLARLTSIPQPSLSRYNSGRCDITLRQLGRIALALGTDLNELVDNESLTAEFHGTIRRMERAATRNDKAWVTRVMADLQRHYRQVRT